MEDGDETVARAAFDALTAAGALEAAGLRRLLAGRPPLALRAAEALRRLDDASGLPRVLELAQERGTSRAEAVRVLGGFRVKEAVPPLLAALEDSELPVRASALTGLQGVLGSLFPYRRLNLQSTGYGTNAPEAQRREGAAKIAAWWRVASESLK
jgi:HEAT repeat protein